jgi:hypothetical protein
MPRPYSALTSICRGRACPALLGDAACFGRFRHA